ncbi:hypothetical protein SUGI_0455480 [Cryptomeria japonica]|nr:hypothetical protein SUGI_0455480 [Cryptomeria japonica]
METNACSSGPLFEKITKKSNLYRAYVCLHFLLLLCFLSHRLLNPFHESFGLWMVAFTCELWFAFMGIILHNMAWKFVEYKTYPARLAERYSGESVSKLPAVDVIITTTDPFKEPLLITANTVLSVLALDYPVEKFACYISDDGASPITFYSLVETLSFAKKWVPFCRKFKIQTRAPFMFFSKEKESSHPDFVREWQVMKDEYEGLKRRVNTALEKKQAPPDFISHHSVDGFVYRSSDIKNHTSIVQVIHENKTIHENEADALPHLIYVAREKRPKVSHHYKAGAMNVMARVSALMTNAPFTLNLDSDMHVNDCRAIQHAMCFFLECKSEEECGFVQFPQVFHGGLKDDPFGSQLKLLVELAGKGSNAMQGPLYGGTCCFHRRKGLYGLPPRINQYNKKGSERQEIPDFASSSCSYEALRKAFGESHALVEAAQGVITDIPSNSHTLPSLVTKEALKIASCSYETKTAWGKVVGWMYGSTVEDVMTGLKIHSLGWHSISFQPEEPVFMGCAASTGPDTLVQQKRWATGLLEIFVNKFCFFIGIKGSIKLRQRMLYTYFCLWAIWSVPVICYALLPAISLLHDKSFLPKISEVSFPIALVLFLSVYGYQLVQYILCGCSVREWWNNQIMWFIVCTSSWLLAVFDVAVKLLGLSDTVFVVTPKGSEEEESGDEGEFTFDSSLLFIIPTTILFLNSAGLIRSTVSLVGSGDKIKERLFAEYLCSIWVVINLWRFVKGLVRKGKRGIPWSVIMKSGALAVFIYTALA